MSKSGKIAIGVVVGVVVTAATWVFLAGGAYYKSGSASTLALSAMRKAVGNEKEVAVMKATMDTHHAAQMQQQDRTYEAIERISDKIDGFHSQ